MPSSQGVPSPEALEARIAELRTGVRRAMARNDRQSARTLRAELRRAEDAWDDAVLGEGHAGPPEATERGLVPVRDQVHQALTLLGVPAAPKLIGSVYAAFFPGEIAGTRLTSLRRDEERSFRTAPYARPYYLCAALTADLLAPARGLITVSTWPLEQRVVGPLSPRTDFLHAALRIAEHARRGDGVVAPAVQRLLWRFASNIPGTPAGSVGTVDPVALAEAAGAELEVHRGADGRQRRQAADRARTQLDDADQLFGSRLRAMRAAASGGTGPARPSPAPPGPGPPAPTPLRPRRATGQAVPGQASPGQANPRQVSPGQAKGTRKPRRADAPASPAPRPHRTTPEDDR